MKRRFRLEYRAVGKAGKKPGLRGTVRAYSHPNISKRVRADALIALPILLNVATSGPSDRRCDTLLLQPF
jgi:hypothetical protein